jgi:hypothetical protein
MEQGSPEVRGRFVGAARGGCAQPSIRLPLAMEFNDSANLAS